MVLTTALNFGVRHAHLIGSSAAHLERTLGLLITQANGLISWFLPAVV